MRTVAVVPAYNEAAVLGQVIAELRDHDIAVVVVDDGSNDTTAQAARSAGAQVLRHFINRGQGAALQTGITFALRQGAEIIVTFDADGQMSADDIAALCQPIQAGQVDVVLGSRFLQPQGTIPAARAAVLRLAAAVTRLYTGLRVTDAHNGFRAISRQAAEQLDLRQDRMAHASELLEQIVRHQLRYTEVPVTVRYTEYSLQKGQRLSHSFRILWDLLMGRFSR